MTRGGAAKWATVLAAGGGVVVVDALTKRWVQATFTLGESVPVLGDTVRLTYILNPGAAFGLHLGPWSRTVFTGVAVVALLLIAALLRATPSREPGRLAALALLGGGALGNLMDRLAGPGGVVDFLDVGVGAFRWPVFNVADVGVTLGALVLVTLLWNEGEADAVPAEVRPDPASRPDPFPS